MSRSDDHSFREAILALIDALEQRPDSVRMDEVLRLREDRAFRSLEAMAKYNLVDEKYKNYFRGRVRRYAEILVVEDLYETFSILSNTDVITIDAAKKLAIVCERISLSRLRDFRDENAYFEFAFRAHYLREYAAILSLPYADALLLLDKIKSDRYARAKTAEKSVGKVQGKYIEHRPFEVGALIAAQIAISNTDINYDIAKLLDKISRHMDGERETTLEKFMLGTGRNVRLLLRAVQIRFQQAAYSIGSLISLYPPSLLEPPKPTPTLDQSVELAWSNVAIAFENADKRLRAEHHD